MTVCRRPTTQPPIARRRCCAAASRALWFAVILASWLPAEPAPAAAAEKDHSGPILYGLDPLLRTTADPRLLGVERLVLRERLLAQGIDPLREARRPGLDTAVQAAMIRRLGLDLKRESEVVEANGFTGVYTRIRYPSWFFLFQSLRRLPGGFSYYPPRPVDAPEVDLFLDDLETALERHWAVQTVLRRQQALDVAGGGIQAQRDQGLLNLTIPIKLPRTLEMIIGRGEKTQIRITGRESIRIQGQTTRSNQFRPSEFQQKQSWFPDLDMEQQLQVNLSGQIGEKIKIEVDHNSQAIGPEATKIKLSYQGDEDDIIRSIETGDVGLTLPGGQLLGYSSNQSGLFGIKVTGQVGPAEFTVVASKQKAESASKTFNSRGGEIAEHVIPSWNYLNNRFFRLDLPRLVDDAHERLGYRRPDQPGRYAGEVIDANTVRAYRLLGGVTPQPGDVQYVAAAIDSSGRWDPEFIGAIPVERWEQAWVWRPVTFTLLRDVNDNIVALDVRQQLLTDEVLAVTYDVVYAATRERSYRVGEDPNNNDERGLLIGDQRYYRMKLLKPSQRDPFTFQYVLRNIYPLGGTNIDSESFELRIESTNLAVDNPDYHTTELSYLQVFGLDMYNAQGVAGYDGLVDKHLAVIFDLDNGLLRFPLDFPFPFAAGEEVYKRYAQQSQPSAEWQWEGTGLAGDQTPEIYRWDTLPSDYQQYAKFRLVAVHAAASSVINLGASNIEAGSVTVTLDGQTLTEKVDYTVDLMFGTIELMGEAAGRLTPDSNIQVNYQYAPFFGGGQSSLLGFNLGYDLGRDSKLNTTWLYESNSIVGHRAKLNEEPSRTLVGNLSLNHTFRSTRLTDLMNYVVRGRRERESTLAVSGETAISIPNPNTKDKAFLEDFEGAASSINITLGRLGWYQASRPVQGTMHTWPGDGRQFSHEHRVGDIRWYAPPARVLRRWLNPELVGQERDETQQALTLYMRQENEWTGDHWGGIIRGLSRTGLDLSKAQFIEFWVNDDQPDTTQRRGRLHIDFGLISEDFIWQNVRGDFETETWQREDINQDGIFNASTEDVGLDAVIQGQTVSQNGRQFSAERNVAGYEGVYPFINRTAGNNYEDSEDLDGNTRFDLQNGYFTVTVDLRETTPLVDVAVDYPNAALEGTSWRKYRIRLSDVLAVNQSAVADLAAVRHLRIWYEDAEGGGTTRTLQLAELAFLGSRWERQGIRKTGTQAMVGPEDLGPDEGFYIGEINNKDNPDYNPPFPVRSQNNIPEKESALILDIQNLSPDHMVRIGRQVSAMGDNYTRYSKATWYWHCTSPDVADLELFYRLGADTTNYYEISLTFIDTPHRTGWRRVSLDLAELADLKNLPRQEDGVIRGQIADTEDGFAYTVRIMGRPDLRRITRFYLGAANHTRRTISGEVWVNDIVLEGAKRDVGMANNLGLRLNLADALRVDFDWNRRDAEFHGLNATTGQGAVTENWSFATNFRIDDFLPLAGFQIPVSLSRRESTSRPKYETNSDIEIFDDDRRNVLSSLEKRDSFSVRLNRRRSVAALPRYLLDPWNVQFSGSTVNRDNPTESSEQVSLQGSVNYSLQVGGKTTLRRVPLLGEVPLLGAVSLLPNRLEASASFTSTDRQAVRKDLDGTLYAPTQTRTKPGTLTGGMEYRPLSIVTANYRNRSERDLLRRREFGGINIGEENRFTQDLTLTFNLPRARDLPTARIYAPLRRGLRALDALRPSLTFQGAFEDDHSPGVRQPGDPPGVRNIGNSNEWQVRAQLPLGNLVKSLAPDRQRSQAERDRLIREQQRLQQQQRQQAVPTFDPQQIEGWEQMTPDQREEAEREWLLEQAEQRLREEGRQPEPAPTGKNLSPRDLVEPLLGILRRIEPVSFSFSNRQTSGFSRFTGESLGLAYRLGFDANPDPPDSLFAARRLTDSQKLDLSTKTRISQDIALDVKYGLVRSTQESLDSKTSTYDQNWPDLRLAVTGLQKLRLFGGNPQDPTAGWFRSSSLDVSYRHSKNVPNYTETFFNPRRSTTIAPSWSMTLQSGMSLTLNGSLSTENQVTSGVITDTRRIQAGLQVQHDFRAQAFLAKLGLYKPGQPPTLKMTLDLRLSRSTLDREVPGATYPQAQQGTQMLAVQPRFSYKINNNLSGAFSLNFSQNRNLATDLKTTTFGLGLEATFVF